MVWGLRDENSGSRCPMTARDCDAAPTHHMCLHPCLRPPPSTLQPATGVSQDGNQAVAAPQAQSCRKATCTPGPQPSTTTPSHPPGPKPEATPPVAVVDTSKMTRILGVQLKAKP
jgi:hypothetical protein